jgi:tetratricopeptide (TPR) repeat protein
MKKILCLAAVLIGASLAAGSEPGAKDPEAYGHFLRGLVYERSGSKRDNLHAMREFEKTLQLDPGSVAAYRELIPLYLSAGETARAAAAASVLKKSAGERPEVQLFLGRLYRVFNDSADAVNVYNELILKDPSNLEALMSLARVYYVTDPAESVKYWKKYIGLDPGSSDAYYNLGLAYMKLTEIKEAKEALGTAVEKDPGNAAPQVALAQIYEYEKDYAGAVRQYEKCIELNPGDLLLLNKLGSLYFTAGDYSKAEGVFREILKLYPDDPGSHLWLSMLYEEKGDWKQAAKYLEYSIKGDPSVSSYIRLSYYYTQLNNQKESRKLLKKAYKLDPGSSEVCFFLALSFMDTREYRKAEKFFTRAAKISPDMADAYYYLGVIYEQTGRFDKSVFQFRKVIKMEPKNVSALNYLGYSFADRGENLAEAEELIKKALELNPDSGAFMDSLGWVYFKKGDAAQAEIEVEKASEKARDPVIYEHLGDIRMKLGKKAEALEDYGRALLLDPANKELARKLNILRLK